MKELMAVLFIESQRKVLNQSHEVKLTWDKPGNTIGGSITVLLTSVWTGLESAVWQLTIVVFICKTD